MLLRKLAQGDVVTYEFRIEEGSTVARMLEALAAQEPLVHGIQARDAGALHTELNLSEPFAEGMFFPDTYQYRRGDLDRDLLLRAHNAMQRLLAATWQARADNLQITSPEEALILASIIEKESGLATDRAMISQVFHNRLAERMLLQTDPTVIYALGSAFDGNLTRAHLKIDSIPTDTGDCRRRRLRCRPLPRCTQQCTRCPGIISISSPRVTVAANFPALLRNTTVLCANTSWARKIECIAGVAG